MSERASFPYTLVQNEIGETMLRPRLPMILSYRKQSIEAVGLIDTGSDVNVLPYKVGIALGAVWDEQRVELELSGNLALHGARALLLSITIDPFPPVQMGFAWSQSPTAPLLLGQVNFFDLFEVCFLRPQRRFELRIKGEA